LLQDNNQFLKSKKELEDTIRFLTEKMGETWMSIQVMPYLYFNDTIKWRVELEEKRNKAIQDERERQAQEIRRAKSRKIQAERRSRSRRK